MNPISKTFLQLDVQTANIVREYHSKTPRAAALKAATQDESRIALLDAGSGKIHIFAGSREVLREDQKNSFTESKNIQTRPSVRKLAYANVHKNVNLRNENDKTLVRDTLQSIMFDV